MLYEVITLGQTRPQGGLARGGCAADDPHPHQGERSQAPEEDEQYEARPLV